MKKSISVVLIALLTATAMVSIGQRGVQADSYYAKVGSPGDDEFCYCVHDGTYGAPDDTWVTLGMLAEYDPYEQYKYDYVYWIWETGVGGQDDFEWWWSGVPKCTYAVNWYGYWSGDVQDMPGEPWKDGDRWYWSFEGGGDIEPSAYVMSGRIQSWFYELSNPAIHRYTEALPDPVTQLTAQAGPPQYYYEPGG